jgi:hypothetical protein
MLFFFEHNFNKIKKTFLEFITLKKNYYKLTIPFLILNFIYLLF